MANEINLKYKVKAEILTPLSIGQGAEKDWVRGIDYIVKDGVCYHISLKKMVAAGIDANKVTALFASGNADGVSALIGNKIVEVSDMQFAWPCETDNPIKTILRNELTGHPVLAGSSLKGAIRSVLFNNLFDRDDEIDPHTGERRRSNELNERTFGTMKDGTDFMRFVRVGDFEFEKTGLVATKIYNLHHDGRDWVGGWKHGANSTTTSYNPLGFNTIYESLLPGQTAEGMISFSNVLYNFLLKNANQQILSKNYHCSKKIELLQPNGIAKFCEVVNNHTLDYLEKEQKFFEKYRGEYSQSIINSLIDIYNGILDLMDVGECSCVLKMSAGSGFHTITGDWQFDDYRIDHVISNPYTRRTEKSIGIDSNGNEAKSAKSRKIVISGSKAFSLMGFVKLTFEK